MAKWIGTLRSRLARRVFLLFVFSALVPIVASALITFSYVSVLITQQSEAQLRHAAKSYGMNVFERLLGVESRLRAIAEYVESARVPTRQSVEELRGQTLAAGLLQPSGAIEPIVGELQDIPAQPGLIKQATTSAPLLVNQSISGGRSRVVMALPVTLPDDSAATLIADIDPSYLWGSEDVFPIMAEFCVLSDENWPLFCSRPIPQSVTTEVAKRLSESSSGALNWSHEGSRHIGAYWELFITGRFPGARWTIVSFLDETDVLVPIAGFKQVFPLAIALSILVVVLLSSVQIRRRLIPLEQLTEATHRIADKDFDTKVVIKSGDELEDLATSFNAMMQRLGRQFRTLTTMSEMDRLILATSDVEFVVDAALKGILSTTTGHVATTAIAERNLGQVVRIYRMTREKNSVDEVERITLSTDDVRVLLSHPEGQTAELASNQRTFLQPLAECGATTALIVPVIVDKHLSGIIGLGYMASGAPVDELAQLRELADRIAVAWSASQREEQLYTQAHYDPLTRLPNRQLLFDRVEQAIARARRENHLVAVLFLDLDRFKNVNDTLGHAAGDTLLQHTAQRLLGCVRQTDTVARLGGDEFTIVLPRLAHPRSASMVADQVIKALSDAFIIGSNEIFVSASIGITVYPDDGLSAEQLLKNADTAMYRAKEAGRSRHMFFEDQMNIAAMERASLERDLRYALERSEFVLHYQPQIDLRTGEVTAAEALLRWPHPTRGLVPPGQFIQLAEDTGLVEAIGQWVLSTAAHQVQQWQTQGINLERVAVNVSSRQFMRQGFVDSVHDTLSRTSLPPECLELEITESLLLEESVDATTIVGALHALGVTLSLDDFGTGYSSLTYLRRFPFATLKIDQSFIRDLPADQDSAAIATSIIALAASLRKNVVAEGVETADQLAFLRNHDCDSAQGFFFSRPLAADDFDAFYRGHDAAHARSVIAGS